MSPQPAASPPPVAMSLRTRESSAMALKHIFDQQISNNCYHREQRPPQVGGFQATRNQFMPDLCKRNIPDLDLSFKKDQDSKLLCVQKGFGSPISTPSSMSSHLHQAPPPPKSGQLGHHNYVPQAAASPWLNPPSRQSTAPMTVFYAGNVNVYDDVPADRAHAIMVLAGNSWSSSSFKGLTPPASGALVSVPPAETMMNMKERAPSPIQATPPQHPSVTLTNDRGGARVKASGSSAPVSASLPSTPASPALQAHSPVAGTKSLQAGVAVKRPAAGIELPHARKVSLARFLEKRKDRVQVQQDQQGGAAAAFEKDGGDATSGNEKLSDHAATSTSSMKRSRSRSSSPSRSGHGKEKSTNNNATDEDSSMNEHCFFH